MGTHTGEGSHLQAKERGFRAIFTSWPASSSPSPCYRFVPLPFVASFVLAGLTYLNQITRGKTGGRMLSWLAGGCGGEGGRGGKNFANQRNQEFSGAPRTWEEKLAAQAASGTATVTAWKAHRSALTLW